MRIFNFQTNKQMKDIVVVDDLMALVPCSVERNRNMLC